MAASSDPARSEPHVVLLTEHEDCGECNERPAFVELVGTYTYCKTCLVRLIALGRAFEDAAAEVRESWGPDAI